MADPGPLAGYEARLAAGELKPDPHQRAGAEALQRLHDDLKDYRPGAGRGLFGFARKPAQAPRGIYLHGPVGRGKSMLMDLFFESAPVAAKSRVHFHAFMRDAHSRIHEWRQANQGRGGEPLRPLAARIAGEASLICFDEFQVYDIADAMILGRLFFALFELGVVVVATSNVAPDDLYRGGLQRELFLPFIRLVKERMAVVELAGPNDFRRNRIEGIPVYHTPLGAVSSAALGSAFRELTGGAAGAPEALTVKGRQVPVPLAARGVARFDFADLCERPLGAGDYLALAAAYHTVILDGVPALGAERRNEAKRFVFLVDALYEAKAKLIIAAEVPAEELYPAGDVAFEFHRTVSRLMEMRSAEYLALPHAPRA
ncbi:MAG: cell division protein ZapE [Thalassobaculales bacterium]